MTTSTPAIQTGESPLQFEFATSHRILFGPGLISDTGPAARRFGSRALLITGRTRSRAAELEKTLALSGMEITHFPIAGEPTLPEVISACHQAREHTSDVIIGFGGGGAMDAAKAVAALLANPGDPLDYMEIVGKGKPLTHPSMPCITLPTTAGSGAEVTRNAVLTSPEHQVKVSLRSAGMVSRLAIVDPQLTRDLPRELTATTGLDALTQLIEPYVSSRANPITDGFCLDGIRRVARSLEKACNQPSDMAAREDMALASLLGGLALANAGLGAVHGFAGPIGGAFAAPHGAVCGALLPWAIETNIHALRLRAPNHVSLSRYRYVSRLLTGKEDASADGCVGWVRQFSETLSLPRLRDFGIRHEHFSMLIEKASLSNSLKSNPIALTVVELRSILDRAW